MNILIPSLSMCKQPAERAPSPKTRAKNNGKRAAPVEILKPHPSMK
jgi:hypothetical protein